MALEPNNSLLNCNFETYRISLKKLNSITKEISCNLYDWNSKKTHTNCSLIKAFGINNNLFLDNFSPSNSYFVAEDLKVYRISVNGKVSSQSVSIVFDNLKVNQSVSIRTSPTLFFPSSTIACLYDGIDSFFYLCTKNRCAPESGDSNDLWELLSSKVINTTGCHTTLLECRIENVLLDDKKNPEQILHCCFMKIYEKSSRKNVELLWSKYSFCDESSELRVVDTKTWRGETPPEMVTISTDFKYLAIIGDHSFRYIPAGLTVNSLTNENIKSLANWWQNSADSVSVQFYLDMPQTEFSVDIAYPENIEEDVVVYFQVGEKEPLELLRHKISGGIDKNLSRWYLNGEMLVIEFVKITPEIFEDVAFKKTKVTLYEVEDVDKCDDLDLALLSFESDTGACVQEISISRNEWLFPARLGPGAPLSACLRHDVDGLLWTPLSLHWSHKHTLNALGYVSAAKTDRKCSCCSLPVRDDNGVMFVAMSDWLRSVCVLMQWRPVEAGMAVRSRASGRAVTTTADEHLLSVDRASAVLGLVASGNTLSVLCASVSGGVTVTAVDCE